MATTDNKASGAGTGGSGAGTPKSGSRLSVPENLQSQRDSGVTAPTDTTEVPYWERDDAPAGSTSASLYHLNENGQKRVSPETHYHHLANGAVVLGYGIGTHHTSVDDDGNDVIVPIHRAFGG